MALRDVEDRFERIYNASLRGDVQEVAQIMSEGNDITVPIDPNGQTILHVAAYHGHYELMTYLLEDIPNDKRPAINQRDKHGWTALLCASASGYIKICYYLINKGADPKIYNDQKTTPLHYLCRKNYALDPDKDVTKGRRRSVGKKGSSDKNSHLYFELLELLVEKGVNVDWMNYLGETPLMQAASKGNVGAIQFLLEHKANILLANLKGETALFYAEKAGCQEVVNILTKKLSKQKRDLISHQNVKLDQLSEVVNLMTNKETGVELKDKKIFFITHDQCCSGSDIVDWILKNLPIRTREEAAEYGQRLYSAHWLDCISKKNKFKDSSSVLYRFSSGEVPQEKKLEETIGLQDFTILQVLGRGAFGQVVLARKKDTGKVYAMKIIEKGKIMSKPRDFKNLMSEKKILQNDCPFLVHLHYAFQTENDFYLVMTFLGGGDLNYHLKQVGRFPERVVQFIAAELVLALSYLHSCGIIYRDLKPQNILLDTDGHVCLADFGLSKEVSGSDAGMHTACGTPSYSAPEVLEGEAYTKSIDWWSFGVCLYQFLVGKTPFPFDGDFSKLVNRILRDDLEYPQDISERARSLLQGFLQKDPRKRLDDPDVIKKHPFFSGIDWSKLEVKKVTPPMKVSERILDNFDPKYTHMPLKDSKDKPPQPEVPNFTVIF